MLVMDQLLYRKLTSHHQELFVQVPFVIIDSNKKSWKLYFDMSSMFWRLSGALLNMLVQLVYPVECEGVVLCQQQFRQAVINKLKSLGKVPFEIPLEDGTILNVEIELMSLTEHYGEWKFLRLILTKNLDDF